MKIKKECEEVSKNSKIVCKEQKSRIVFNNSLKKMVSKIKVDGCQIADNGIKCDYLIVVDADEHFVELKGHNVSHAFKQLKRTIKLLGKSSFANRYCYVISSRSPLVAASIQVERLKFLRTYNSNLIVKTKEFQVSI